MGHALLAILEQIGPCCSEKIASHKECRSDIEFSLE